MASILPAIDEQLRAWLDRQHMFFVATAPSGDDGHVSLSPKGLRQSFVVLGAHEVAYVDLYGSGIETVAHLKQNGRVVVMFCAFDGPPRIVRFHGRGEVVEQHDPRFPVLRGTFELPEETLPAVRGLIRIDVTRISDSCGFTVPEMDFRQQRQQLFVSAASRIRKSGENAIRDYCDVNNGRSIDGLPGLTPFGATVTEEQRRRHDHAGRKL